MSPDPRKVSALKAATRPINGKEALSFISMAKAISADFIPDFASIAAPIYNLTRKNVRFKWS